MGAMASQITSLTIVYSTVYSGVDQRKHQSSASLAKWPVTRKMFLFDDVIMIQKSHTNNKSPIVNKNYDFHNKTKEKEIMISFSHDKCHDKWKTNWTGVRIHPSLASFWMKNKKKIIPQNDKTISQVIGTLNPMCLYQCHCNVFCQR